MTLYGLAQGLRTFRDWREQSVSGKRVVCLASPGERITNWTLSGGGVYVSAAQRQWGGVLLAITGVRCGISPYRLARAESEADCLATDSSFFYDPDQQLDVARRRFDDGVSKWDASVQWDTVPQIFVHLPGGVNPATTTVVVEYAVMVSARGVVVPDLGQEKIENYGFEAFDEDGVTPTGWTMTRVGGVAGATYGKCTEAAAQGEASLYMRSQGGTPGAFDDAVTKWDAGVSKWDVAADPSIIASHPIAVKLGSLYRASADYRYAADNDAGWKAYARITTGAEHLAADGFSLDGGDGWQELADTEGAWKHWRWDFVSPWDGTIYGQVRAWNADAGDAPAGEICWDNFRCRRIWRMVFSEPRVAVNGIPSVSQSSRDVYFGGKSTGSGGAKWINSDGRFDSLLAKLDWAGCDFRTWVGGSFADGAELDLEQYEPTFVGVLDDTPTLDDAALTMDLLDYSELANITIPVRRYTLDQFADLAEGWDGRPRAMFLGPKTNVSPAPVFYTDLEYRVYEIADPTDAPAGLYAVSSVYAYPDETAAEKKDIDRRRALTEGTDYEVDLATCQIRVLSDVRVIEVASDQTWLDWVDGADTLAAQVEPGFYLPRVLAGLIEDAMVAAGSALAVCVYDEIAKRLSFDGIDGLLVNGGDHGDAAIWGVIGADDRLPSPTLAGAGAGNVNSGTHSYKTTFVGPWGECGGYQQSAQVTTSAGDGQVDVEIPVGPEGTTSRRTWRTVAGDTGAWKFLTTTDGNDEVDPYRDNLGDTQLGVALASPFLAISSGFIEADTDHVIRVSATGYKDDSSGTYTGTAGSPIQIGSDEVRYIISTALKRPAMLNDVSLDQARIDAPAIQGIYLNEERTLQDVLDTIERGTGAVITFNSDGMVYMNVATADPSNAVELFDRDFLSFSMQRSTRDALYQVILEYDRDPTTGVARTLTKTNKAVLVTTQKSSSQTFDTFLITPADASIRLGIIAGLADGSPRLITADVKHKLSDARIGTKVLVTRERGADITGALSAVLFRVLDIDKDQLSGRAAVRLVEVTQ